MSEAAVEQAGVQRTTTALACAVGTAFGFVPLIVQTFPMFLKPLAAQFGWARSEVAGLLIAAGVAGAVGSPIAGWLTDRLGARPVVLPGTILFGLGVLLLPLTAGAPWLLYGVFLLLGLMQTAAGPIPYNKVIAATFHRHRGMAIGLAVGGALSIGNGLAPQLARTLLEHLGWREAYGVLGLLALGIVPILWAWLREPPRTLIQRRPIQGAASKTSTTRRQAFTSRNFWLTVAIVCCFWAAISGLRAHLAALLTDRGQSTALAANTLSIWSVGAFAGHIFMGYALDRARTARVAAWFFAITLAGFVLMVGPWSTPATILTGAALTGLGMGAEVTLAPYVVTRFFGLASTAEIYAYITVCTGLAGAIGPYLMGLSFDVLHSYGPGLLAACVALAACVLMCFFFGPYIHEGGYAT
jgi:predicted MFS family arabinose efflux permease